MKNIIITLVFIGGTNFLSAQSTVLKADSFEIKPISLHLTKQKTAFTLNYNPTVIQHFLGNIPTIKNHPFGDYPYHYLNPNNTNTAGKSVAFGLANYFLDNTINKK